MSQPLIAVGIGNTRIQFGIPVAEAAGELPRWEKVKSGHTASFNLDDLSSWLPPAPQAWHVASVHRPCERRLAEWVAQSRPQDAYRSLTFRDLPLTVDVERPDRVGMDRLVAAVAANRLRDRERAAVVIDAGTATTVDAVSADGVFRGGVILPGFRMIARALAADTDLLPLVETSFLGAPPPAIGKSTEGAIRSGLFWGGVGALRHLIDHFRQELGQDAQLYLTGGDAEQLCRWLDDRARFVPELVLAGVLWSAS